MGRRRRAVGLRSDRGESGESARLRQLGKDIGGELRDRVGIGIDPGREIEERFGRAGKEFPGRIEVAAMDKRRKIEEVPWPRRSRFLLC
jgi:hypothetical protein